MSQEMQQQQQRQKQAPVASPSRALSADELSRIITEASRRQGEQIKKQDQADGVTTIEDAYALAKELGIPENYVAEAAAAVARDRDVSQAKARGRFGWLGAVIAGAVAGGLAIGLLGFSALAALVVAVPCALAWLVVNWMIGVARQGVQPSGASPVPGICRVCFRPAHTPESTFCEEHRYKSPAELGK